ncbi:RagB/SusD family nutrient uptake outer membrane protein [Hymenobacter nivis]|uniref:RagB/SusD family nutrient uptake outer membrane protein n=1 Tax=Hymenobacter nivis TaxID=1850093 RepID=A0A2Z3GM88_9BACT|nr:RagB/SusD family nutrient uptake outer membrane protein [Hymenobacter nivis]AWM33222.1 RagB/SusD family nutrient uptake outer membrane protein [Hymenobacter nivis]
MKKILFGLLAACLATGTVISCNNKLNVVPVNSIDAANALNTSDDVQAALVGSYTSLQSADAYGGYVQFDSDLLADDGDFTFVGTFINPYQFQRKSIRRDNTNAQNTWAQGYTVINRANNVLANLDKVTAAASKTRIEGEARFLRGLSYFDLVRLYARAWNDGTPSTNLGVPVVTTPTTVVTNANLLTRNTVAEVYTQIIADLTAAEAQLPTNNGIFANKYAAAAIISRVYLQQGRYPEAAAAANRATAGPYLLNPVYNTEFYQGTDLVANTPEDIFTIQNSAQSGTNQLNVFYAEKRRGDVSINSQLLKQFEAGDARTSLFTAKASQTYSNKYDAQYGTIKLIRLAEMYLTRAEANFRAGTAVPVGATPLSDVNLVRARVGLPALATVTLPIILKERKLELAFEGFRLGDLKRNQESTTDPATGAAVAWNSPRLVLPIPLAEINVNPNLVQNPGY